MNRLYKYSTFFILFLTSGILYIIIGSIDNSNFRYKLFDFFQIGTSKLYNLVDWKFNSNKDNTFLVSNYQISPIVNFVSSVLWTTLLILTLLTNKKFRQITDSKPNRFWKKVFFTNLTISGLLFMVWLIFIDSDFIYAGVYNESNSIFSTIYEWFLVIVYIPSIIPRIIGSITLDQGGDTTHGFNDMLLMSKTMTSFALTIWSIIGVWIYDKLRQSDRKKMPAANNG